MPVFIEDPVSGKHIPVGGYHYRKLLREIGTIPIQEIRKVKHKPYSFSPGPPDYWKEELTDRPPSHPREFEPIRLSKRDMAQEELEKRIRWYSVLQKEILIEKDKMTTDKRAHAKDKEQQKKEYEALGKEVSELDKKRLILEKVRDSLNKARGDFLIEQAAIEQEQGELRKQEEKRLVDIRNAQNQAKDQQEREEQRIKNELYQLGLKRDTYTQQQEVFEGQKLIRFHKEHLRDVEFNKEKEEHKVTADAQIKKLSDLQAELNKNALVTESKGIADVAAQKVVLANRYSDEKEKLAENEFNFHKRYAERMRGLEAEFETHDVEVKLWKEKKIEDERRIEQEQVVREQRLRDEQHKREGEIEDSMSQAKDAGAKQRNALIATGKKAAGLLVDKQQNELTRQEDITAELESLLVDTKKKLVEWLGKTLIYEG